MDTNTIGTLNEKSVHSFIKEYIEPNKQYQEVKVDSFIADIKKANHIYEIQTQQFKKLLPKLKYYISNSYNTTIVYPVIQQKYINWINPDTQQIVERRKSSHKGVIQDIFKELYWIASYIENPLVELQIILIDAKEYKLLDGYRHNLKRKSTKIDKVPTTVKEIIKIKSVSDLEVFIPNTLKEKEFTSADYIKHTKCNKRWVSSGLKMLREYNIIRIVRKEGNKFVYKVVEG